MRLLPVLVGLVLLLIAPPAPAQSLPGLGGGTPPAGPADGRAEVDALVRILQDDAARAALIARLKAEAPAAAAAAGDQSFAGRVADYTSGAAAQVLALLDGAVVVARDILGTLRGATTIDLGMVWWAVVDVVAVMAVTFGAFGLLRWIVVRLGRGFAGRAADGGRLRRWGLTAAAAGADLLGVVVAWGVGQGFALGYGAAGHVTFSQALFLNAFLFVELAKAVLRAGLMPGLGALRAPPLDDTDAAYWYFWSSRLTSLLGYSFLFAAPLVQFSGSWAGSKSIRLLAMATATTIVVTIVLQNRARVRDALAARLAAGKVDMIGRVAAYLGTIWHILAIGYALAVFVVWLANPYSALAFMLQATVQSVVAGGLGVVVVALISNLISRGMRLPADVRDRLPLLETRLNAFVPAVLRVVRLVVMACVLVVVAQVWGLFDAVGWLADGSGRVLVGRLISVVLLLLVGGLLYLVAASWVEYRLNPNYGTVPTARERTLLALFRNAFTIALAVVVAMLVLSELGVNIAPLLAGAGVLGLAIGFGAQKLVQDIITGIFIQFENAMNEGEVVTAAGVSGLVERLTIRSVSIRDLTGVLHVIPFSAVDRVANMMRHFSCHLIEIGVSYGSDIPAVKAAIQEAFERLKQTEHGAYILEPLEMYGLARFGDSALVVMARFKTTPGKHWNAGRAYNEIVKQVFDERGIEIPFPQRTVHVRQDQAGPLPEAALLAAAKAAGG